MNGPTSKEIRDECEWFANNENLSPAARKSYQDTVDFIDMMDKEADELVERTLRGEGVHDKKSENTIAVLIVGMVIVLAIVGAFVQ